MLLVIFPLQASWGQGITLVRDAEIERYIKSYSTPIWLAAGLDPDNVQIHLVNNKSLNAFVAGGQRIFIFSGLLLAARDPSEVIGVLAHETGHITGGHLARFQDGLKGASTITIISMLLGAAAMAAGAADAGAAIMTSGGQFATRSFLTYSRTQESSADQAGLQFLTAAGMSGRGLISFFEFLGDQEALLTTNKDPYVRSHPLTQQRVESLRYQAEASPFWNKPTDPVFVEMLARIQAKLHGFLTHPRRVFTMYPIDDKSDHARYARAVAYHREGMLENAIEEMDALLEANPKDPYYWELKGQILFESGKLRESIEPYRRAVIHGPNEPLLRVGLAQSLLSLDDEELAEEAIVHLERSNRTEPDNSFSWFQLAKAYTLVDNKAMASLASAERAAITGSARNTIRRANYARENLEEETPSWYRAQDLYLLARNAIEDQYRRKGKAPPPMPGDPPPEAEGKDGDRSNKPDTETPEPEPADTEQPTS
ncbi:MAG: M48 family peptidase [Alphaproteobacteria bacterium]|nr:MAG: M48 family peptidase [Alphaproteobacteria bacterium]